MIDKSIFVILIYSLIILPSNCSYFAVWKSDAISTSVNISSNGTNGNVLNIREILTCLPH